MLFIWTKSFAEKYFKDRSAMAEWFESAPEFKGLKFESSSSRSSKELYVQNYIPRLLQSLNF